MITTQELEQFIEKLLGEQSFHTTRIKDIKDSKERKETLKTIEQYNKLIGLLYDLKI